MDSFESDFFSGESLNTLNLISSAINGRHCRKKLQ